MRRVEGPSVKMICARYFPWQLIIMMPNWLPLFQHLVRGPRVVPGPRSAASAVPPTGASPPWAAGQAQTRGSHRPSCRLLQRLRLGHGSQRACHAHRGPSQTPAPPRFGGAAYMKILARAFNTQQVKHMQVIALWGGAGAGSE